MVVRFLLIVALVAPRIAEAQGKLDPQAQVHLDAALKAYEAKDWDAAIREFEQAYALDPKPALLYATAQAYRFANRCGKALELYRRYLAGKLTDTQIAAAKTGISLCEPKEAPTEPKPEPRAEPKLEPRTEPPGEPLAKPVPSVEPLPERRPWYTDGVGDALTASGVVGIAVGATFLVMAGSSESAAKSAQFRDDFLRDLDDATQRKTIGWTSLGIGSALAVGGVLVYVLRDRGHHPPVVGTTDGHAIYLTGAF